MAKISPSDRDELIELFKEAYENKKKLEGLTMQKIADVMNSEGYQYSVNRVSRYFKKAPQQIGSKVELKLLCGIVGADYERALLLRRDFGSTLDKKMSDTPPQKEHIDFQVVQFCFESMTRETLPIEEPDEYNFPKIIRSLRVMRKHIEALGYSRCDKPTNSPNVNKELDVLVLVNPLKSSRNQLKSYGAVASLMQDIHLIFAENAYQLTLAIKSYREQVSMYTKLTPKSVLEPSDGLIIDSEQQTIQ